MLKIIRETKDYIIVSKPSGLITEKNSFENSLETEVYKYLQSQNKLPFLGVVHRLDKVTSGLVLFAKKKSALVYFNQQFENKKIRKTYLAIVHSPISNKKTKLNNFLEKDTKNKKAIIYTSKNAKNKNCILEFHKKKEKNNLSLLTVWPKTGRFHQIRAQLSHYGSSIIGDNKYGNAISINNFQSICLHAASLEFIDFNSDDKILISDEIPNTEYWKEFKK